MKLDPTSKDWLNHLDEAFGRAIAEEIAEHKRLGHPIYYGRRDVIGVVKEMSDGTCYEVQFDQNGRETIIREIPKE